MTLYRCRKCGIATETVTTYQTVRGSVAYCHACQSEALVSDDEAEALAAARLFEAEQDAPGDGGGEDPTEGMAATAFAILGALAAAFALALFAC